MERNDPSALRWLIGVELINYRKESTLTQAEATRRTGIGKAKLSSMESGRYQQHPDDVTALLNAYGVAQRDIDRITSLTGRAESRSWLAPWSHVVPDWFRTFVGLEGLATAEFAYDPLIIPGLLQTMEYAEELTRATGFVRPDHSERFVSFRLARARRLTADTPLALHAVIGDAALRLTVGDVELRRAQYQHLVELAKQPNITIQVIRPEDGPHGAGTGQFVILEFDKARPIAYSELLDGASYVQDQDQVATYRMAADSARTVALSPEKSMALLRSMINAST
ncbi:helix-turn-helix domain-containing protein [Actinocatenispora comari]|uniref:Transcriptional regulator n=1 Tax=Actinocatenispora comari TaxID=2807577 RepID=A0A8J4ELG2_9ACTN|nr:helix-turn-helix transcriptional regulator [Actinocatenispora comari]GIL29242.1 transcriptional regulator [Actinocatenispora comari]